MKRIIIFFFLSVFFICGCGKNNKEDLEIEFSSNPYTLYTWSYSMEGEGAVKVSEDFHLDSECNKDDCDGIQYYKITGLNPGKVILTFEYKDESNTLYEAIYDIEVLSDLTLTENHKGSYFK